MFERNVCVESGCLGGCCYDITIYDAESVILRTFPNAKEVNAWQLQSAIDGNLPDGVYYLYDSRGTGEMAIARVVGHCPNKKKNGSCGRRGRCSHAGENFKFGSVDCNGIRRGLGLEEII
jgi:hypothetical protein